MFGSEPFAGTITERPTGITSGGGSPWRPCRGWSARVKVPGGSLPMIDLDVEAARAQRLRLELGVLDDGAPERPRERDDDADLHRGGVYAAGRYARIRVRGGPRRAAHPPRRLGRLGDPLAHRPRAGDRAAGEGLLGVRPARHRLRPARRARPRRAGRDLPLDGADPVEPARGRALGARGDRRRVPLAADHDARAALQPDEAKPRRRARPRPHHHGRGPRARPREPRVPAGARRADPDDGPHLRRAAERDHRREGDPLRARAGSSASTSPARGPAASATPTRRSRRSSRRRARPASA